MQFRPITMAAVRHCGCKGVRTCLICEQECGIAKKDFLGLRQDRDVYVYCPSCNKAWSGWDAFTYKEHPNHNGTSFDFAGIYIQLDFLSVAEEEILIEGIDEMTWDQSQSGRRKQSLDQICQRNSQKQDTGGY